MATAGPEAWQQRMKAEKERLKASKSKTAELHQNYRTTELSEADLKLKALKQEERRKQQETAEMWRQFKKLEIGEDEKLLASLKQEERRRLQETERMHHTHQNNTISESDMKLSLMRQEERRRMQEHEAMLRKVNHHTPGFKQSVDTTLRRSSSHDNLKEQETKKEEEPGKPQPPIHKAFRRSSIGTVISGDWKATSSFRKPKATNNQPVSAPAPVPTPSQAIETVGNASTSSIQSLKSLFSKGNPTPPARPLYVRKDSETSLPYADPIDQDSNPTLETPEPSERVEVAEQSALTESRASTVKAAMSVFNRNTGSMAPLLPPVHNTHVASKTAASPNGTRAAKPSTPPEEAPKEKENGINKMEQPKEKENDRNKEPSPPVERPPSTVVKPELPPVVVAQELEPKSEAKPIEQKPPPPEDIIGDELLADPANIVRLDVLFSFGLLTSSDQPVFTNYMNAVEQIAKKTVENNSAINEFVWYDPVYPPFVQDYKNDDSYKDPSGRGNVRRLLVIAAIPIFLTSGISVKEAREGVCMGLQGAINSGEFIRLAKSARKKRSS